MPRRYRATGADPPFGDWRAAHGVEMEGYFWRFTDPRAGRVVIALCGVSSGPAGRWAAVALGGHPGGFLREADLPRAGADEAALGAWAGDGAFVADEHRLHVDLGDGARLDVRLHDIRPWPRRAAFGGLGAAHAIPGLSQYWHPHALGGRAEGRAVLGGETVDLDGAEVYAEKNWGRAGFPEEWWWGQAHGFERPDALVAFAGGDVDLGPLRLQATGLVVALGDDVLRFGNPLLSPVHAAVGEGSWRLRGRSPRWRVEVEAHAPPATAHVLPVPDPAEGRSFPGALEHLAGELRVTLRRRGRGLAFAGSSPLAGLEHGGRERVRVELERRRSA